MSRVLFLLTLWLAATGWGQQQPPALPFYTAPLETVATECRNGTYGVVSLNEISG